MGKSNTADTVGATFSNSCRLSAFDGPQFTLIFAFNFLHCCVLLFQNIASMTTKNSSYQRNWENSGLNQELFKLIDFKIAFNMHIPLASTYCTSSLS